MLGQLTSIFVEVVLPVLMLIGIGAVIQRLFRLDIPSLTRLNIYLLVPAFLFVRVRDSTLGWGEIASIALAVVGPMAIVGVPMFLFMRARKVEGATISALLAGSLVINAGNFGIPVADLLHKANTIVFEGVPAPDWPAIQAIVVLFANLSVWGFGYMILALAKGGGRNEVLGYFKLPMFYVVVLAFVFRETGTDLHAAIDVPIRMIADATVPIMLITLAAQLVERARWPRWRVVLPAVSVKLLLMPAVTAGLVVAMGLWPWPGAALVIASAAPTAVNTLLIALKLDGDADLAADCVFWSTVVSAVTVTGVVAAVAAFGVS